VLDDVRTMDEAHAKRLIETHLKSLSAASGWTYIVVSSREHAESWAFGVQPLNADGQPSYDTHGFEVNKLTGEVRRWT